MDIKGLYLDYGSTKVREELNKIDDVSELKNIYSKSLGNDYHIKKLKGKESVIDYIIARLETHPMLNDFDLWDTENSRKHYGLK